MSIILNCPNLLRHARTGKDIDGIILVKGDFLVGYIAWSKESIIALEVMPEYKLKRKGLYKLPKNETLINIGLEDLFSSAH